MCKYVNGKMGKLIWIWRNMCVNNCHKSEINVFWRLQLHTLYGKVSVWFCYVNHFEKYRPSSAKGQDLRQFVGDATGSMPVCYINLSARLRPRPQSSKIYSSLSVMPPTACRFVYALPMICARCLFPASYARYSPACARHRDVCPRSSSITTVHGFSPW